MARVLLVEDEPDIASIIVFKLEREGHQVRWQSTAPAVLAAAGDAQPDLVLLDSSPPDGDPFALLSTLAPHGPVVMMTEFRDSDTPVRARSAGAVATVENRSIPPNWRGWLPNWSRRLRQDARDDALPRGTSRV